MTRRLLLVLLLGLVALGGATSSQALGGLEVGPWVVGGGGGHIAAGVYGLDGTLAQQMGGTVSIRPYLLCSGYWCNVGGEWRVHLPLVMR